MAEDDDYARLVSESWQAYHADDCAQGIALAEQAIAQNPDDGRGHYIRACLLERLGRLIAADRGFRRSASCDHEPHPAPFRLSWRHFESAVARAAEQLPAPMQQGLSEVDLVLSDYPGSEITEAEDNYEMLGLFSGPSKADLVANGAEPSDLELPPRIYLYRRAHEHIVTTTIDFDLEVRRTLYHELGHYLGFDENDMVHFGLD